MALSEDGSPEIKFDGMNILAAELLSESQAQAHEFVSTEEHESTQFMSDQGVEVDYLPIPQIQAVMEPPPRPFVGKLIAMKWYPIV